MTLTELWIAQWEIHQVRFAKGLRRYKTHSLMSVLETPIAEWHAKAVRNELERRKTEGDTR